MGLQRSRKERACHTIGRRLHTHVEPGMLLPRAWRRVRAWLAKTIKKRRTPRALKESYPAHLCTLPSLPGAQKKVFYFYFLLFLICLMVRLFGCAPVDVDGVQPPAILACFGILHALAVNKEAW